MEGDKNLARRSFKAASWVLIAQFATQFVQLFLGICMVRLLSPADYGVLGMLTIFWAISNVFIFGGFTSALIQRKEITQTDLCSVFYYNMFLSLLCCFIMIGASHWIAEFYNQPILEKTIKVTAWTLPIGSLSSIQSILLCRELKHCFITVSDLLGVIVSGSIALFLAWKGYGVWALVWRGFISTVCSTLFVFLFVRWIPRLIFSLKALGSLFKFGSKLMVSVLLDQIFVNLNNVVIGKFYQAEVLGYYERARGYAYLWPTSIQGVITSVLFPSFSKIQDDLPRLRSAFQRSLNISVFAIIFPSYLLCTMSRPFIELILAPKWLPCIPYWWLLTTTVVLWPIHALNLEILKAQGRTDLFLWLEILKKCMCIISIIILIFFGIYPMLLFGIVISCISAYLNSYYVGKILHYNLFQQLIGIKSYVFLAFVSCLLTYITYYFMFPYSQWAAFILASVFGSICYILLNRICRTSAFIDLVTILSDRFPVVLKILCLNNK